MARRLKLLTGLSTVALTGALALAGCGGDKPAEAGAAALHHGEAEGEAGAAQVGGEAEGAAMADVASDKSAFLSALQIVRGHLRAGVELYAAGDRALGPQHLRHPQAEIMTTLRPAIGTLGATNFEPAIDALAAAGEAGAAPAEIAGLEASASAAIERAAAAANATVKEQLLAAARTLSIAGDEYSIAVKDGAIVNLHEYHDAYGFIAIAIADVSALSSDGETENAAIAAALEQLIIASEAALSINPPTDDLKPASLIYGAAARIEITARTL